MCARVSLITSADEIADFYGLHYELTKPLLKRYSIAPTQPLPVARVGNAGRELAVMRWGLIPHWTNEAKPAGFINARSETIASKPAFRDSFRHRRCLVPTDGLWGNYTTACPRSCRRIASTRGSTRSSRVLRSWFHCSRRSRRSGWNAGR